MNLGSGTPTPIVDPQAPGSGRWRAAVEADPRRALQARSRGLEVAGTFEQVFVQQMVEGLRRTGDPTGTGDGPFGDGPGSDTYTMWFDRLLGERIAGTGELDIAGTVVRELERLEQIPRPSDFRPDDFTRTAAHPPEAPTDVLA